MMSEVTITHTEAAKRLGISLPTFNRLMKKLKIRPVTRGRYYWEVIENRVRSFSQQG